MSLDKAIKHGKEKREPYRRSKAVCRACRNHGSCDYCQRNRLFTRLRDDEKAKQDLELQHVGENT